MICTASTSVGALAYLMMMIIVIIIQMTII